MLVDLESTVQDLRAQASAKLLEQRQADISTLSRLVEKYLRDAERHGTVKDAMLLLGRLRAVEAVGLLTRNLTLEVFYKSTKRPQTTEDLYPAVQALIDIGSPSIAAVLARIVEVDEPEVQRAGAAVLRGVLGLRHAHAVLADELRARPGPEQQRRLGAVADLLDRLP